MAAAPEQTSEPLLGCGHSFRAVVTSPEGTSYCGACADLAEIVQVEAEEEIEQPDAQAVEEHELEAEPRQDGATDSPPQPVYGTRADIPGPRGCMALTVKGEPCGAAKRRDGDFCTAHAGLGVASDPSRYSPLAHEARRRQLQARASMRLLLGDSGRVTPRNVLRAAVVGAAEPLVGRAINAALSPEVDDAKAAGIALKLIEVAEPRDRATLEITAETDLDNLSLSELMALAAQHGLPDQTPPEAPPKALDAGA